MATMAFTSLHWVTCSFITVNTVGEFEHFHPYTRKSKMERLSKSELRLVNVAQIHIFMTKELSDSNTLLVFVDLQCRGPGTPGGQRLENSAVKF